MKSQRPSVLKSAVATEQKYHQNGIVQEMAISPNSVLICGWFTIKPMSYFELVNTRSTEFTAAQRMHMINETIDHLGHSRKLDLITLKEGHSNTSWIGLND